MLRLRGKEKVHQLERLKGDIKSVAGRMPKYTPQQQEAAAHCVPICVARKTPNTNNEQFCLHILLMAGV